MMVSSSWPPFTVSSSLISIKATVPSIRAVKVISIFMASIQAVAQDRAPAGIGFKGPHCPLLGLKIHRRQVMGSFPFRITSCRSLGKPPPMIPSTLVTGLHLVEQSALLL